MILTSAAPRAPRADAIPARGVFLGKPFEGAAMASAIRGFVGHEHAG